MKPLKRIRYFTMNSWNLSKAPAYNLKVYNVVDDDLQDKVFELMETDEYWHEINSLVHDFDCEQNYHWQAGFNGRSGGYLVLYRGGVGENGRSFCYPGKAIEDDEVPADVKKSFRRLAIDIIKISEQMARKCKVIEKEILVPKTIKSIEVIAS